MRPHVSWVVWLATFALLAGTVVLDLTVIARRRRTVTVGVALRWIAFYVTFALAFAAGLLLLLGSTPSGEFLASYVTEYSLSADNLFVFMMLMARFAVPAIALDRVLYLGIVLSLVLRGLFIAAGAAVVNAFSWIFYLFGAFLIYTAVRLVLGDSGEGSIEGATDGSNGGFVAGSVEVDGGAPEGRALRLLRRVLPTTAGYVGRRYLVREDGRARFTPLVLVTTAIGLANVVFALDSIPAVFGLTRSGYLVFTANAFAMLGLRQLYFLISGLLRRIVYLSAGLSVILGFIGVKLVLEALRGSHVAHLGPVRLPTVGTGLSLAVILGVLGATTLASLVRTRRKARGEA